MPTRSGDGLASPIALDVLDRKNPERRFFLSKSLRNFSLTKVQLLNLCPLTGNRQGELTVLIGLDGSRTIEAQIVEVVAELESGLHDLVPGDFLPRMTGCATHERCQV